MRKIFKKNIRVILSFIIFFIGSYYVKSQVIETFTSSTTWTCPAGVTSVTVECWGGGGAGGGTTANNAKGGGGGAGGAYAKKTVNVIPGNNYTINVGNGGIGTTSSGNPGGASWFGSPSTVYAEGGAGGAAPNGATSNGGVGSSANSIGDVVYAGGNGANGTSTLSGGGGGGAGSNGIGGNASGTTAGSGTSEKGGNGGTGLTAGGNGNNGQTYGGGGSGAFVNNNTDRSGGSGANGFVRITYTVNCNISTFPWTENFDAVTIPNFPICWYKENGDWVTTNNSNSTYDADARSGSQFLRESYSAINEFIWTPGFTLTAGTTYEFSFWWAGDNYSGWTGDVFYNTSQNSSGATQLGPSFVTADQTTTKTYSEVIRSFTPSVSGTYYFAIRINASFTPWYISFDDFSMRVADNMSYVSSTVTQNNTSIVTPGSTNNEIICIRIITNGSLNPLNVTQFSFSTSGSSNPSLDILNAKLWYTGSNANFATISQFGSIYSNPDGDFIINGNQDLLNGVNYFWLTYDITTGATLDNFVDAACNQITIQGSNYVPSVQSPVGNRQIKNIYLISNSSTVTTCSGFFYDSGGQTGDYANSENYTKTFVAATPGSALQFTFTEFNTEANYDYLYVYDGGSTSAPQITGSPFNGTTLPPVITANGDSITFKFTSDGSTVRAGWNASLTCVPITPPNCITYLEPNNGATDVCPGSVELKWSNATTGFKPQGYKIYFGTDNPPTNILNGVNIGNVNSFDVENLNANTLYYWKIEPFNSGGTNTGCSVQSFTTANIEITGTNSPITTCQNTATLTATGSGTINWYTTSTGGVPVATGSSYNATFSGNTTYYVSSSIGSPTEYNVGKASWSSSDGYFGTSDWGLRFTTYIPLTIKSVNVYLETANSTVIIKLQNSSGSDLQTFTFNNCPAGLNTLNLNCLINNPGDYRLVSGNSTYLGRGGTGVSFPYTQPGVISITASEWGGTTISTYYFFYNWVVQAAGACESARVPVEVFHTAEPININPDGPTTFLDGGSVGLSASSFASPAYTYTWTPSAGLNTTTGANVTASPNVTTTYTVTGTNGSCTNTSQITVTVTYPCTGLGTGFVTISSLPFSETSTTCGAVNDLTSSNVITCGSSSYLTGEDKVYSFTPDLTGTITIDLTSTGTWTGIMLYKGCPVSGQGGECIVYQQSSSGNKSMCISVEAYETYYLIIDSYASPTCNPYTISISQPDPIAASNDLPCNATTIAIGGIVTDDNTCSSGVNEPSVPSCWTSGTVNSLWYKFQAPASGSVKIKTNLGTLTATQIAVYQGNCNNLVMVTNSCNQDAAGVCSGSTQNSAVTLVGLSPGDYYYIVVDGENELVGSFSLQIIDGTENWPTVPQQDCSAATLVCNSQTLVGDPGFVGAGSTCDFTTPYGCFSFGTQNNTVWYKIDIANDGQLIFEIIPNLSTTDYDWALVNITGNPNACTQIASGSLLPVRCNFSGTSGNTGLRTGYSGTSEGASGPPFCAPLTVSAGQSYQLLIWNWSGNNTGFNLDLTNSTTGSINYDSPSSLTWSGGASSDWFNPLNWGGCAIPNCNIDVIIVNGPTNQPIINAEGANCKSISIQSGASLTINAGRTLVVCDDFENLGTLNISETATILLNDNWSVHEFNGNFTGTNALGNLEINKLNGSVRFLQDIAVKGNFITQNSTSIVDVNEKNIIIGGNFQIFDGTFTNYGHNTITFNGNFNQIYSPGGGLILHNVVINKSAGELILDRNLELDNSGQLSLINGIINTNLRKVVINNTLGDAIIGGNANSYIFGDLRRYIQPNNITYSFPVGTSSAYRLAQIINNNLTGVSFIDASFSSTFSNTGSLNTSIAQDLGTPYSSISGEGIWILQPNLQPTGGSYSINLWFNGGGVNSFGGLFDNQFGPLKRPVGSTSASEWTIGGGTLNAENTPGRTVAGGFARRNGLTEFSEFAIAKSDIPLPIVLQNFKAICADNKTTVSWTTISESNNDYFSVLKSTNAKKFEIIGTVKGQGNSNIPVTYLYSDPYENNGDVFYKLLQHDFDGKIASSQVISTRCYDIHDSNKKIRITNNQSESLIEIQFLDKFQNDVYISLIDNLGRIIYYRVEKVSMPLTHIISTEYFAPGLYNIIINSLHFSHTEKITVVK